MLMSALISNASPIGAHHRSARARSSMVDIWFRSADRQVALAARKPRTNSQVSRTEREFLTSREMCVCVQFLAGATFEVLAANYD